MFLHLHKKQQNSSKLRMCINIPSSNQTKILLNIQVKLKVPATTNNKVKYGKHQISFNRLLVYFQRLRFSILVYVVRSS